MFQCEFDAEKMGYLTHEIDVADSRKQSLKLVFNCIIQTEVDDVIYIYPNINWWETWYKRAHKKARRSR